MFLFFVAIQTFCLCGINASVCFEDIKPSILGVNYFVAVVIVQNYICMVILQNSPAYLVIC